MLCCSNQPWQYACGIFPDIIKFRIAAHTISEKAIRFQHPDYNRIGFKSNSVRPMSWHLSTRNTSSKSMYTLLSNLAQTDRQTNKCGQTHLPSPLSEVKYSSVDHRTTLRPVLSGGVVMKIYLFQYCSISYCLCRINCINTVSCDCVELVSHEPIVDGPW